MTLPETVRGLLIASIGEALCDSCLAFASSASLADMQRVTESLLTTTGFERGHRCAGCRRTVAAITYRPKCAHCSRTVGPGEDALLLATDVFHAVCLRILVSEQAVRDSRTLTQQSRQLIEKARRQIRLNRRPPS